MIVHFVYGLSTGGGGQSLKMDSTKRPRQEDDTGGIVTIPQLFNEHLTALQCLAEARRQKLELRLVTRQELTKQDEDRGECVTYTKHSSDRFMGDPRLRTVHALLHEIDCRGFERANHQARFHDAFIRACSRVLYREEWAVHRDAIRQRNNWENTPSEIMISTPRYGFSPPPPSIALPLHCIKNAHRRFGKTFSIAMFCVAMALSFGVEVVVFSPASRASRKLLERMHEFVVLLGMNHRVIEYNKENLRLKSLEGNNSLIRSFPSRVSVRHHTS